jgi:hypothetical protein
MGPRATIPTVDFVLRFDVRRSGIRALSEKGTATGMRPKVLSPAQVPPGNAFAGRQLYASRACEAKLTGNALQSSNDKLNVLVEIDPQIRGAAVDIVAIHRGRETL